MSIPFVIRPVRTRADRRRFLRFPWQIYSGDPHWVPPLLADVRERLDRSRHPFFEHAEVECFLALRGGEVAGRITAAVDRNHNAFHGEAVVFFGFYESINDAAAAAALLDAAAEWGRARGMGVLRGPMNLSLNDECAFLLEGFDSPPMIMTTYNPPYYNDLMEACGLRKAKDLFAATLGALDRETERGRAAIERARRELGHITLRRADRRRAAEEANRIGEVFNRGWERNWGFVPWTPAEMAHMVGKLKLLADPDMVIFGEAAGRPVGFALGLPDYNEILARLNGRLLPFGWWRFLRGRKRIRGMRAAVFGILPEYRQTGLSFLLFDELKKTAVAKGFQRGELSWLLEDNQAVLAFSAAVGARLYKTYRIYEKSLDGPAAP